MSKPMLLDLFCGAGGAAVGYDRAGFDVVGVDIAPQKNYPFPFWQRDALEFLRVHGKRFDAIHASPPCQGYSRMNHVHKRDYPMLIEPVRELLTDLGKPCVIENVEGAPLKDPITLCGVYFGLGVIRHRLFETSFHVDQPIHKEHVGEFYSPAGHGEPNRGKRESQPHRSGKGYAARCRAAMGIDWMNRDELGEAIPPAYTEYIGLSLMAAVHG